MRVGGVMKKTLRWMVAIGIASAALPCGAQSYDFAKFVWQSRNETLADLSAEFASLYRDLIELDMNGKVVPSVSADLAGRPIEQLMRDRQLFAGEYLPRQLDVYVCRLNPAICSVRTGRSGDPKGDDATAQWRNDADPVIRVPD